MLVNLTVPLKSSGLLVALAFGIARHFARRRFSATGSDGVHANTILRVLECETRGQCIDAPPLDAAYGTR
jgi:hypothetical protein